MPLVGHNRAMAHYKRAVRYNEQNKPDKSRAHLRRALEYASFGTYHEPYDPDKPAYVPGNFEHTHEYLDALEQLKDHKDQEEHEARELPTYYTMRNPPIHAQFVHPLVNVWVESRDEEGATTMVNVYRDVDTEAHTHREACGLVDLKHEPVMEPIKSQGTFEVTRTNGTKSKCVAFNREFMHGFLLCLAVDEDGGHGRPITVLAGTELTECSKKDTDSIVGVEKRRRAHWTDNKMYRLDAEGYRTSIESDVVDVVDVVDVDSATLPLVNVWRLSRDSRALTNIYRRDDRQLHKDPATGIAKRKRLDVEKAYAFLTRVSTTSQQVHIANLHELDSVRHKEVNYTDKNVLYMKKFLEENAPEGSRLVMPPFCVFYEHAFGRGRESGRVVTIVNIRWYEGLADQVTLKGEWVNAGGVPMVRVFTAEIEFLNATRYERDEQEKKIEHAKGDRELEERIRKRELQDDLAYLTQPKGPYMDGTTVPSSEILGILGTKKDKEKDPSSRKKKEGVKVARGLTTLTKKKR